MELTILLIVLSLASGVKASVMSATICEHKSRNISCEVGETIRVLKATYGRDDNETCSHELTTNCSAGSSLSVVQSSCNDQASCNLNASNSVFGDPCVGTIKYLRVTYRCIKAPDPCDSDPCQKGGTCTNLGDNNFKCDCAPGFGGDTCEKGNKPTFTAYWCYLAYLFFLFGGTF
ncbi:L-rhamnose-binding lectin ELEL-1-like [Montipora capricornis]|uniref:L-rhamnose-binding lectin ELEL-1-like n=1 Tax=Montipora capricornis TaxID=246305 RepID=UPI0035F17720